MKQVESQFLQVFVEVSPHCEVGQVKGQTNPDRNLGEAHEVHVVPSFIKDNNMLLVRKQYFYLELCKSCRQHYKQRKYYQMEHTFHLDN